MPLKLGTRGRSLIAHAGGRGNLKFGRLDGARCGAELILADDGVKAVHCRFAKGAWWRDRSRGRWTSLAKRRWGL